ncbi:hypothetical protein [Oceanibaculum nanhaiense]|uniref:hypothetical protein n=1 Tax=Oceanibaculum nanhaiense TaxID=1909734 RepID=UPI003D2BFD33
MTKIFDITDLAPDPAASAALAKVQKEIDQIDKIRATAIPQPVLDAQDAIDKAIPLGVRNLFDNATAFGRQLEEITREAERTQAMLDQIGVGSASREMLEKIYSGPSDSIGSIIKNIEAQDRHIIAMEESARRINSSPPHRPELNVTLPPNPLHETNDRLDRIEKHSNGVKDGLIQTTKIWAAIQNHIVLMLAAMQQGAEDAKKSSRRAIILSVSAIAISVLGVLAPIVYDVFWRSPQEAAAAQVLISEFRTEIRELRQAQIEANAQIAGALARSDQETAEALKELARALAATQAKVTSLEPGQE